MTTKEIRLLFPLKVKITDKHRETAIKMGGLHRLGDILLKEFLPEILHESIFWGLSIGSVDGVGLKTEKCEKHKGGLLTVPAYLDSNFSDNEITFKIR